MWKGREKSHTIRTTLPTMRTQNQQVQVIELTEYRLGANPNYVYIYRRCTIDIFIYISIVHLNRIVSRPIYSQSSDAGRRHFAARVSIPLTFDENQQTINTRHLPRISLPLILRSLL